MKIIIAGASGFIGTALARALKNSCHEVWRLVRNGKPGPHEISWDPAAGTIQGDAFHGADAIVNLAGTNVAGGRWTQRRKQEIFQSRVDSTRTLITAVKTLERKPSAFVSASGIGYYGDRGDEGLTESSSLGQGFLPEVCLAWETHAEGAARLGVRTVLLRFGMVLGAQGGALAKMLPVFRKGLGGRLGRGEQWMSWIALADAIGVLERAIVDPRMSGPFNVVAPHPARNVEFTATLLRVLRRPALCPVPAFVLKAVFGEMAKETLLASGRAEPKKLQELGFAYRFPSLDSALREAVR